MESLRKSRGTRVRGASAASLREARSGGNARRDRHFRLRASGSSSKSARMQNRVHGNRNSPARIAGKPRMQRYVELPQL